MTKPICKIVIQDQVNIRLNGLDPKTRRLCVESVKYKLPQARFIRKVKMGQWDGCVSFCTAGGQTYLNLLPKLFEIVQPHYDFEIDDQRPDFNFQFQNVDKNFFADKIWGPTHKFEGQPIILEDHQVNIINTFLNNYSGVAEAGTGAGKTIVTAAMSKLAEPYGRTIVIVPSKDLVIQTEADYKQVGLDVGVFYGGRKEFDKTHTICTWQSLNRLSENSKDKLSEIEIDEFLKDNVMVLVDECHLAPGESIRKLLSDPFRNTPLRWGLTGTVPLDAHLKTSIRSVIGDTLIEVPASELQEAGFLAGCKISIEQYIDHMPVKPKTPKVFGVPDEEENFSAAWQLEAEYSASDPRLLRNVAARIDEISKTGNTFVLVGRREACEQLQKLIPDSVFLHGSKKSSERKKEYDEMNVENNKVIIATFGIASTGLNIPRIFNLILYDPGKSFIKVIQSIGRGLRKARDKEEVMIYDICTTNKYSSKHLTERKKYYKKAGYPFTLKKVDKTII